MKNKRSTIRWIFSHSKKYFPAILLVSLFNIAVSFSLIALAAVSKNIIDAKNVSVSRALIIIGLVAVQLILNAAASVINVRTSGKLAISMRNSIFSTLIHKKQSDISKYHSGDILNRMTSDVSQVVSGTVSIIPSLSAMLAKIIIGTYALVIQNYIFAIIVIAIGFIFPLFGRIFSKKYKEMHKLVQETEGKSRSFIQEGLENTVVIKTFGSENPILDKLNEYMDTNLALRIKQNVFSVFINICLYSCFTFGYYGVVLWGVAAGLTYGTLYYLLELITILRSPLQNISGILPRYYSTIASAERIIAIDDCEDEPQAVDSDTMREIRNSFETIDVNGLSFSYDSECIIKNSSFKIHKNEITIITGESGSGKSTFFKLLLGFLTPTEGTITFNGTIKIDASVRSMFSYVPQGNMILSGTIRDNITLCNKSISEDKIIAAAKAADIYGIIESLPNGLDTLLSERGAGLSEGQIQRIAVARALLFDAPILLLDESTSALDIMTETTLLENIKNMTDKTVIFITHRKKPTDACDRIINLNGKTFHEIK